jgi:ABC-2 type transport system permease protein
VDLIKKKFASRFTKRELFAISIIGFTVLLFLGNLVFFLLVQVYPFLRVDLTQDKLFRLSQVTKDFIKTLDKDVTIYVLAREETFTETSPYNAQANQVFRQFERNSSAVSLVYVDYVRNPGFAAGYPDLAMKHGDILVACESASGIRHALVKTEELFNYSGSREGNYSITSSRAEEAIYTAILSVSSGSPIRAALVYGHGEYTMDAFTSILEKNNYEIRAVSLMGGGIDPSFDLAILIAPKDDLGEEELRMLDDFLFNGGSYNKTLFYCADAEQPPLANMAVFLREWGIAIEDGAVFETNERRVYNYQPFYPITDYVDEEFSSLLRFREKPMLVPVCRPLTRVFDYLNNYSVKVLLEFAVSAGVKPSNALPDFTSDDAVARGPVPALLLGRYSIINRATGKADAVSNVLVSGSAAMLDSFAMETPAFSNTEYLVGVLNHLSNRRGIIPLRPKSFTSAGLNLPRLTVNVIGLVLIAIIPLLILTAGLAVWINRKHA